jgi:glyoxylase-like metal-dependent hydrolase (beta-lactamase superfamily II)
MIIPVSSRASFLALVALAVYAPVSVAQPAGQKALAEIPAFEVASNQAKTVFYGRFGRTNCAWVDMGEGVLLIDTGGTEADARNLAAQVKETTKGKPVKWFVLTHLHADSNTGLKTFLPSEATVIVNSRVARQVATSLREQSVTKGKVPSVLGVTDHLTLSTSTRTVELFAAAGSAHTSHDLFAYVPENGTVFAGDLLTTARCPMLSDPECDPDGWLKTLSRVESLAPALVVPSRGNSTTFLATELSATRDYLTRILGILTECKKQNWPEARVSSQLALNKVGEYCPPDLDAVNALALYKRIGADGKIRKAEKSQAPAVPSKKK